MRHARLLKFRLIAPTQHNWKRLSIKCPLHGEWTQYIWNQKLPNCIHDQIEDVLTKRLGFDRKEILCFSEDKNFTYVLLTNHDKHILKEENH